MRDLAQLNSWTTDASQRSLEADYIYNDWLHPVCTSRLARAKRIADAPMLTRSELFPRFEIPNGCRLRVMLAGNRTVSHRACN